MFQQIKLTLGKDRPCPPLTAQIIPAHLAAVAAAAAAAIGNSFPHRTNHASNHNTTHTLFQTQSLPAALLRPAPGPIRTSHSQVLFAPYWPAGQRWNCSVLPFMGFIQNQAKESAHVATCSPSMHWYSKRHGTMWIIILLSRLKPDERAASGGPLSRIHPLIQLWDWTVPALCAIPQPAPQSWIYITPQ